MSNFICPTCGVKNIDCGKAGYKTAREIELEKKLEIAVQALEEIVTDESCAGCMDCLGSAYAEKALAKIKEIK